GRVSSVSGGSITAGVLALHWDKLNFDATGVAQAFREQLVAPVRELAGRTIDIGAVARIILPGAVSDKVASSYDDVLFHGATLPDITDQPRFVFNATNMQSGALWRFSKRYMADYKVGIVRNPKLRLATAVAASSAFPPVLSPVKLKLDEADFAPGNEPLHKAPFTTRPLLTDG